MNMLNFPGICCYISQGPDYSGDDLSAWVEYLTSLGTDIGAQSGNYSAERQSAAHSAYDGVTKIGPVGGAYEQNYDPEFTSFLVSEGV